MSTSVVVILFQIWRELRVLCCSLVKIMNIIEVYLFAKSVFPAQPFLCNLVTGFLLAPARIVWKFSRGILLFYLETAQCKATKMRRGLELLLYEERPGDLESFSLERRRQTGLYKSLSTGWRPGGWAQALLDGGQWQGKDQ